MVRLGQRLKEERIRRKLTLEEVSVATKIKLEFLAAIEKGAYDELPSPAYAKGFAKNYADYLGLPRPQSSALFKRDFDEKKVLRVLPEGMTKDRDFPLRRLNLRNLTIGVGAIIVLFGFLLFQYRSVLFAPQIDVKSPKEGAIVSQDVEIAGSTDTNAIVTINNESVFVKDGNFSKTITLFPGKTSVVIKAINRLGKESIVRRNITIK